MKKVLADVGAIQESPAAPRHKASPGPYEFDSLMPMLQNKYTVAAIGNFDGVHLGHAALFAELAAQKTAYGGKSAVLTFDPHPLTLITDELPLLLNSTHRRKLLIEERYGVDKMIVLPFDEEFSHYLPEEFVERIIVTKFGFKHIVVGFNFHFGAGGRGDAEQLAALCAEHGIDVSIIPAVSSPYGIISATSIRTKIEAGDIVAANEMLGYWYGTGGRVIMGNQIGRTIGFPTANFLPPEGRVLPPYGVYAARIEYSGGTADGIVNFGYRPTVGDESQLIIEAHIFDVDLDLYDQNIFVYFGFWLRPEVRFESLDDLQEQLKSDAAQAREIFTEIGAKEHLLKLKE